MRIVFQQMGGIVDTAAVDEVGKRLTDADVDGTVDVFAVGVQTQGKVVNLQVGVQEELLAIHYLYDLLSDGVCRRMRFFIFPIVQMLRLAHVLQQVFCRKLLP